MHHSICKKSLNDYDRRSLFLEEKVRLFKFKRFSFTAVGDCPAGWNLFGDSCYYSDSSGSDWNSAEENCVSQNAHLVSINDDDEQSYISSESLAVTNHHGLISKVTN